MRRLPRAGADEVGQGLTVAVLTQPDGHRLHRFPLPVQQQSPQTHPAPPTLIRPSERLGNIRRELLQGAPDFIQLPRRASQTGQRHNSSTGHATSERT